MGWLKRTACGVGVAVVLAAATGCRESADPPQDTSITVVDLNAAMGFGLRPGNPDGTDATPEDIALLADDILKNPADIVNLQEMAVNAARDLRSRLAKKTGSEWQLNWAHSTFADYYAGKVAGEAPVWKGVSAGNAQLIRIGDGIRSQRPITVDDDRPAGEPDQGIMLPSSPKPDRGRSFQGTEITTEHGTIDVYNLHLALARDHPDEVRARDVEFIQQFTESRTNPAIITGDFNQTISISELYPGPGGSKTETALAAFMQTYKYTDVAKDLGPTSNRQPDKGVKKLVRARIDYILARGVDTVNTARLESHESDHWGLVTTVEPGSERATPTPAPSTGASADRYRQELPGGGTYYFFTSADGGYNCGVADDQAVCQGQTTPVPPPPASCRHEGGPTWGHGMFVATTGEVDFVCAGGLMYGPADRSPDDRDILQPGQSFTALGFTCAAEKTGIRCEHNTSSHGFFIAPDSNKQF
jgi:endonuclease/exonuclease/phosphatase family metal-dependent hydrolase